MNMVVLTAALSSLNAGLYSTGRILHSMSMAGSAPRFAGRMNKAGVPYGGIALTALRHPAGRRVERGCAREAFEIVLNVACYRHHRQPGRTIVLCQLKLLSWAEARAAAAPLLPDVRRTVYRLPDAGVPGRQCWCWSAFDYPVGTWTVGSLVVIIPLLVLGWFLCRDRITAIAAQRDAEQEARAEPVAQAAPHDS